MEEEFLMFTAEIQDRVIRRQDGPHQTLRWRKKLRMFSEAKGEKTMAQIEEEIAEEMPLPIIEDQPRTRDEDKQPTEPDTAQELALSYIDELLVKVGAAKDPEPTYAAA